MSGLLQKSISLASLVYLGVIFPIVLLIGLYLRSPIVILFLLVSYAFFVFISKTGSRFSLGGRLMATVAFSVAFSFVTVSLIKMKIQSSASVAVQVKGTYYLGAMAGYHSIQKAIGAQSKIEDPGLRKKQAIIRHTVRELGRIAPEYWSLLNLSEVIVGSDSADALKIYSDFPEENIDTPGIFNLLSLIKRADLTSCEDAARSLSRKKIPVKTVQMLLKSRQKYLVCTGIALNQRHHYGSLVDLEITKLSRSKDLSLRKMAQKMLKSTSKIKLDRNTASQI